MKRILTKIALLFTIFSCFSLSSCGQLPKGDEVNYTFNIKSIGGLVLDDVELKIFYRNRLVKTVETNDLGVANASLVDAEYNVKVSHAPDGYYQDKVFYLNEGVYEYTFALHSRVIDKDIPKDNYYNVGEVMYDFTYTDSDGNNYNLIKELESHDAVVINFWFSTCQYCFDEFPALQESYELYKDKISLIALSISDYNNVIDSIKYDFGFTFPMAFDNLGLHPMFGFSSCPSTVIIDRYGIVSFAHSGALTETSDWTELYDQFIGDEYKPVTDKDGNNERIPTLTMPSSSDIEEVVNGEGMTNSYHMDENESELAYKWPWIISSDGESIIPSNSKIGLTASSILTEVYLDVDQCLAFDYLSSTENNFDVLYITVDGKIVAEISGIEENWKTCFTYVANEARIHNFAFTYFKDDYNNDGEDVVYIKNIRVVSSSEINVPTYIYRHASQGTQNLETSVYSSYSTVVFNEEDKYYHVNNENGPLLQAELIYETHWTNDTSLYNLAVNGMCQIGLRNYNPLILEYCNYANNSDSGLVPVTQELYTALNAITKYYSQTSNENEWLEVCGYFDAYGTNGEEMPDPIKGLATFSAYEASLDDQNFATFNYPIVPRGKKFAFTPEVSGVYFVTTIGEKDTVCWIFDEFGTMLAESTYEAHEFVSRKNASRNFKLYYYMEKDITYYITPAFNDIGETGTLQMSLSYIGEQFDYLTACAPGYFTTGIDSEGNMTDEYVALNIPVAIGDDGYYHELREDGSLGSIVYADFYHSTQIFTRSLLELAPYGVFDFSKDEEENSASGQDLTALGLQIASTVNKDKNSELYGMVPVTQEIADLLQKVMDKYTFVQNDGSSIDYGWTKLCYYYQHFGPISSN